MSTHSTDRFHSSQRGGITIIVALMLLVLLTVAAMGMARNSLREIMITATARPGAIVRNMADTGLEWSVYWLIDPNLQVGLTSTSPGAQAFTSKIQELILNAEASGIKHSLAAVTMATDTNHTDTVALDVTRMGKLEGDGSSQNTVSDWRLWPDAWAIRSNANVTYASGIEFVHAKEAWLTTPVLPIN